jgi:hypothetical protein
VRHRGVAGAEVVEREPDAHLPQLAQLRQAALRVHEDDALGDLQAELLGPDAVAAQHLVHLLGDVGVLQPAR